MSGSAAARVPIVRPAGATIARGVVDLHAQPDRESELVDQVLFGEMVTLLGEHDGWAYVQGEDQYLGWIEQDGVRPSTPPGSERIVVVQAAVVRAAADPDGAAIDALAPGTSVSAGVLGDADAVWIRCGGGWIAASDTVRAHELPRRPPDAADLLATAETFLGTPYLWGGLTVRGIDCSGLTQQVYRLNGVALPRDADQQALAGRSVEAARAGDLFFFGDPRVTHTAIATGPRTFLHAPRKGGSVERGELGADRRLLAIRRYLP